MFFYHLNNKTPKHVTEIYDFKKKKKGAFHVLGIEFWNKCSGNHPSEYSLLHNEIKSMF